MPTEFDDEDTPVNMPPSLDGMDKRLRATHKLVKECVDDTKAGRTELQEHRKHDEEQLKSLHAELEQQRGAITALQGTVTGMAGDIGEAKGSLKIIAAEAEETRKIRTKQALAVIGEDNAKALAVIEDKKDSRKTWRSILRKILSIGVLMASGGGIGAGASYLGLGC